MGGRKKKTKQPPPPPPSVKQVWVVKKPQQQRRNWLDLPNDVTAAIMSRVGAIDMIERAQFVCKKWRRVCSEPIMWRIVDMRNDGSREEFEVYEAVARRAVDLSRGGLVDITLQHLATDELLQYIAERSSGIRRLRLLSCEEVTDKGLIEAALKLRLLEELEITLCRISHEALHVVGSSCPLLKSLKFNKEWCELSDMDDYWWTDEDTPSELPDADAVAIAGTMPGLQNLHVYGNKLTDDGLNKILDSCPHLESLDLRRCANLTMGGDWEIRCAERIKKLWLPLDSTEGKGFTAESDGLCFKWTDLPDLITFSILSRVGAVDILENAQKVCMKWRNICKDPIMWRAIDMQCHAFQSYEMDLEIMCHHAIDRSCGNFNEINIEHFGTDRLLEHITDSSSKIKHLRLASCEKITDQGLIEVASKLPLLEDLEIFLCHFSRKSIEVVGRSCPLLKSFKLNGDFDAPVWTFAPVWNKNDEAHAIARTMHGLQHLQLVGNHLDNGGLKVILDGCPHLQSLDLRECYNLCMESRLGKRCSEQIKKLWLPNDSTADIASQYPPPNVRCNFWGEPDSDGQYGCSSEDEWYDDFTKISLQDRLGLDREEMRELGYKRRDLNSYSGSGSEFGDPFGSDDEDFDFEDFDGEFGYGGYGGFL